VGGHPLGLICSGQTRSLIAITDRHAHYWLWNAASTTSSGAITESKERERDSSVDNPKAAGYWLCVTRFQSDLITQKAIRSVHSVQTRLLLSSATKSHFEAAGRSVGRRSSLNFIGAKHKGCNFAKSRAAPNMFGDGRARVDLITCRLCARLVLAIKRKLRRSPNCHQNSPLIYRCPPLMSFLTGNLFGVSRRNWGWDVKSRGNETAISQLSTKPI